MSCTMTDYEVVLDAMIPCNDGNEIAYVVVEPPLAPGHSREVVKNAALAAGNPCSLATPQIQHNEYRTIITFRIAERQYSAARALAHSLTCAIRSELSCPKPTDR